MTSADLVAPPGARQGTDAMPQVHGRTTITARALNRVVTAVAGTALGVEPKRVSADVTDERGHVALSVRAPVRLPSLAEIGSDSGGSSAGDVVARGGGSILDRAERARSEISSKVEEITGSSVARVVVRLESANIVREKRVG